MASPTYTAGELARMAGISPRMLRHYDKIGLLHPKSRSEGGYRLYDENSLIRLQKIIMLRYLDFSLEQIGMILESGSDQRLTESLAQAGKAISEQYDGKVAPETTLTVQVLLSCLGDRFNLEQADEVQENIREAQEIREQRDKEECLDVTEQRDLSDTGSPSDPTILERR